MTRRWPPSTHIGATNRQAVRSSRPRRRASPCTASECARVCGARLMLGSIMEVEVPVAQRHVSCSVSTPSPVREQMPPGCEHGREPTSRRGRPQKLILNCDPNLFLHRSDAPGLCPNFSRPHCLRALGRKICNFDARPLGAARDCFSVNGRSGGRRGSPSSNCVNSMRRDNDLDCEYETSITRLDRPSRRRVPAPRLESKIMGIVMYITNQAAV